MEGDPVPAPQKKWWSRKIMDASGILRARTIFLPLPRRPAERARRRLWRPSLRANLLLLVFALLVGAAATAHRRALDGRFARLLAESDSAPFEIKRIREDLTDQAMDEQALVRELDARLKYARSVKAHDFYIVRLSVGVRVYPLVVMLQLPAWEQINGDTVAGDLQTLVQQFPAPVSVKHRRHDLVVLDYEEWKRRILRRQRAIE